MLKQCKWEMDVCLHALRTGYFASHFMLSEHTILKVIF